MWTLICEDTSAENGPELLFDHQMCMDIAKRNIYVFGGRILTARKNDVQCEPIRFSGLFVYNIPNNTWTSLLVDYKHPSALNNPEVLTIKSRVTHSMLFHHVGVRSLPFFTFICCTVIVLSYIFVGYL